MAGILFTAASGMVDKEKKAFASGRRYEEDSVKEDSTKEDLALQMTKEVIGALRRFLNDEVNKLEFALSVIGEHFLKPETGKVLLITHALPEEKVAAKVTKKGNNCSYFEVAIFIIEIKEQSFELLLAYFY